ncbi:MAG: hypothetical protein EGP73_13585, partial [Alistipes indistinctus]|uniref:hypothetical protein n=1 Tax=Alistipes indistinctus TaxID=626932 RepID=UPI00241F7A57
GAVVANDSPASFVQGAILCSGWSTSGILSVKIFGAKSLKPNLHFLFCCGDSLGQMKTDRICQK